MASVHELRNHINGVTNQKNLAIRNVQYTPLPTEDEMLAGRVVNQVGRVPGTKHLLGFAGTRNLPTYSYNHKTASICESIKPQFQGVCALSFLDLVFGANSKFK